MREGQASTPPGRRVVRGLLGAVSLVGTAVAGIAATPGQAHAADGITLQVAAGIDGQYLPAHALPVTVTITADRLVRGELTVRLQQQFGPQTNFTDRVPVEVPAGSAKTVTVVLPSPNLFGAPPQLGIEATLLDGNRTLATGNGAVTNDPDREIVGLLASLALDKSLPKTATPVVPIGALSLVPIDDELAAQPGAIEPADQIVVTADDLARLPDGTRANVLDWVAAGGQLVVVDDTTEPLASLPAAWQPKGGERVAADLGVVRRVATAGWWKALEPTQLRSGSEDWISQSKGFGGFGVAPLVAREAGLKGARIAWLGAFLGAYVVLVGLVLPIVLRRTGRSGLLWVAVPLAALVFTAGAWVAGRSLRANTTTGHVTVFEKTSVATRADSWIGAVSRGGGALAVDLPAAWSGSDQTVQFSPETFSVTQRLTNRGQRLSVPLAAGQFGMVQAAGRAAAEAGGGLEVAATSDANGKAHVSVTNRSAYAIEQIGVVADAGVATIARLAPGEQQSVDITGTDAVGPNGNGVSAWTSIWPDATGMFGPPSLDGVAVPSALDEVSRRTGSAWVAPGIVRVVGWTRDAPAPLAAGSATARGRTAIITSAPVTGVNGAVTNATVRRRVVRSPNFNSGDPAVQNAVLAYDLPAGSTVDAASLRVRRPAGTGIVEALVAGKWVTLVDVAGSYVPSSPPAEQPGFGGRFPGGGIIVNAGGVAVATTAVAFPVPIATAAPAGPSALPDGTPAPVVVDASQSDNVELRLPAGALVDGRVYLRVPTQNPFAVGGVYVVAA